MGFNLNTLAKIENNSKYQRKNKKISKSIFLTNFRICKAGMILFGGGPLLNCYASIDLINRIKYYRYEWIDSYQMFWITIS